VLGLPGAPFHEPFHARRRAPSRRRHRAQRPGSRSAMPAGAAGHGPPARPPPGTARGRAGHRVLAAAPRRRHHPVRRHPARPPPRPAVPRRARRGSRAGAHPGSGDDERQMPACGRLWPCRWSRHGARRSWRLTLICTSAVTDRY